MFDQSWMLGGYCMAVFILSMSILLGGGGN